MYLIWRGLYQKWNRFHADNVEVLRSIFHVLVPYKDFHVVGDILAPYALFVTYGIIFLAYVDAFLSDVIHWGQFIKPLSAAFIVGFSLVGTQIIKSWWERIQMSTSYNFFVGDTIEIGDELKGVVKAIKVSYVHLIVTDDEKYDTAVDKYVPPVFIQDKVITIVKKARRLSKSKSEEDLSMSGDDYYDDFVDVLKKHIISDFLTQSRDYALELVASFQRHSLLFFNSCGQKVGRIYGVVGKRFSFTQKETRSEESDDIMSPSVTGLEASPQLSRRSRSSISMIADPSSPSRKPSGKKGMREADDHQMPETPAAAAPSAVKKRQVSSRSRVVSS